MVGQQQPRNVAQKDNAVSVKGTIVDITTVWYTVPAGKKAIVSCVATFVAYGACTQCGIKFGGVNLINYIFGTDVAGVVKQVSDVTLNAGETIIGQGDGANPTVNFSASIRESLL